MSRQHGFLIINAIVIIVIFAITTTMLVSIYIRAAISSNYLVAASKASAAAESGLQQGLRNLTYDTISSRQTCGALSNTTAIATGNFTVIDATDEGTNPRYASSPLTTFIAAAGTPATIVVANSGVFSPSGGRVLIGREVFQYKRLADATTLTGISRAQDGTLSNAHLANALVSQFQCTMAVTGNSPATTPAGVRQYKQGVQQQTVFTAGAGGTILRWDSDTAPLVWQSMSPGTFVFNAISALNYHSAWAVADDGGNNAWRLSRLHGNTWANITITQGAMGQPARNLYGVYATSDQEAWAVGQLGSGNTFTILRWIQDGANTNANWCDLPCTTKTVANGTTANAERELFAVKTIDTNNDGFADMGYAAGGQGGTGGGNRGIVMSYNGTQWAEIASYPATTNRIGQLYGVDIVVNGAAAPKDAYFVGRSSLNNNDGKILSLRDGVWTVTTTTTQMRSVSVVDMDGDGYAEFGAAVGLDGAAYTYDGTTWTGPNVITTEDLYGVHALSSTDVWVVGTNGSRFHYDGVTLISLVTGAATGNILRGLSAIYPQQSAISSWYDVIN